MTETSTLLTSWDCCNVGCPSDIHFKHKSREISYVINISFSFSYSIFSQFRTERGDFIAKRLDKWNRLYGQTRLHVIWVEDECQRGNLHFKSTLSKLSDRSSIYSQSVCQINTFGRSKINENADNSVINLAQSMHNLSCFGKISCLVKYTPCSILYWHELYDLKWGIVYWHKLATLASRLRHG